MELSFSFLRTSLFFLDFPFGKRKNTICFFPSLALQQYRKNTQIRLPRIFLVGENGEQLGEMPTYQALQMAESAGLDLVEISAKAHPPVCRIMDYGSFAYEQKKKEKESKKKQKAAEPKGIRLGIRISEHDFETKARSAQKFLAKGHPVKVTLQFRGREVVHENLGFDKMQAFQEFLAADAVIEAPPKKQGKQIHMFLRPKKSS